MSYQAVKARLRVHRSAGTALWTVKPGRSSAFPKMSSAHSNQSISVAKSELTCAVFQGSERKEHETSFGSSIQSSLRVSLSSTIREFLNSYPLQG